MGSDFDDFEGVETHRLSSPRVEEPGPRWLVVLGAGPPSVIELARGASLVIGRAVECDLTLPDRAVSRRHAVLRVGRTVTIEDLGSANGLTVAGVRVEPHASAPVPIGSAIQIGAALLVAHGGPHPPRLDAPAPAPVAARRGYVVEDAEMRRLHELIARVAPTRLNVLLLGETGAGKEILAEALHAASPRAEKPFVTINCAALAPQLLESELFGHERGAFTGADQARAGLLESADGGTLMLDEVGEMPLELQAKLLRVIEDLRVKRVGSVTPRSIDVRFVAATNRDLAAEVARGAFRRDLYYRLNGINLEIPPLRARPSEILPLAKHFLARAAGHAVPELDEALVVALLRYDWPGNVRELRNVMERALALSDGRRLGLEHVPRELLAPQPAPAAHAPPLAPSSGELRDDLAALEKQRIVEALARCDGNQTKAAKLLGMPRRTLISRIEQYDLPRPRKK